MESSERLGATGGIVGVLILTPIIFIGGPEIIYSWRFWGFLIVGSYLAGGVISALVCRLAPYEEVRASAKQWWSANNVGGRHRRFFFLELAVFVPCVILMMFARSLPIWLLVAVSVIIIIMGVFGAIASWRLYFGEHGIFRRWRSDDRC